MKEDKSEKKSPEKDRNESKQDCKDLVELDSKIAELTDLLKRTQAEFINYKARVEKESRQLLDYANVDLIKKMLPVLDSFDMALKNKNDFEKFKKGMELIYAQLFDVLRQEGVEPINAEGQFDPYLHEVLMKEKSDKPEDTIIEEFQKGYKLKDRVLRHSKVKVSG